MKTLRLSIRPFCLIFPFSLICLSCVLSLAVAEPAGAEEIEGVRFVPAYRLGEQRLTLQNAALMRYRLVFKALVAGLYLAEGVPVEQVLADVPKRLEIHYFWPIQAKDIVSASEGLLAKNVDAPTRTRLRTRIDRMHALYQNVKAGDRYALTYVPGTGTQLSLNGKSLGIVPGADFAAAYFTIWFGRVPMDVTLKQQLLRR